VYLRGFSLVVGRFFLGVGGVSRGGGMVGGVFSWTLLTSTCAPLSLTASFLPRSIFPLSVDRLLRIQGSVSCGGEGFCSGGRCFFRSGEGVS